MRQLGRERGRRGKEGEGQEEVEEEEEEEGRGRRVIKRGWERGISSSGSNRSSRDPRNGSTKQEGQDLGVLSQTAVIHIYKTRGLGPWHPSHLVKSTVNGS